MEEQTQKNANKYGNAMKYAAVGTQMMVLLGLGVFGGMKLDEKLNTSPLFLVVFPVVALFVSLYQLYRQLVKKQ
ncbi:AtpZ/AtpI family protein [Taibaiella lutea]|uniref:AtpZ/AtpI family protein n=1 Tax=Taibaiella lutea TaxID=2608001 RepID=A0A5M6CLA8_9BACT|nr:AtpZ/AtpI family protein [Taibaiella lutea]KAA5534772.1 AtpZ/AtpI family protein [Taibaiella lutea]